MSNALFGHINKTRWAAVRMMFARQDVESKAPRVPRFAPMSDEHLADVKGRCERRFEVIDELPPAVRRLVHEYSWRSVKAILDLGVKDARKIEHIIREVRGIRSGDDKGREYFP